MTISCPDTDTQCPQIRLARPTDLLVLSPDRRARAATNRHPREGRAKEAEHEPSLNVTHPRSTLTLLAEADGRVVAVVHLKLQTGQVGLIHGLWIADAHQESTLALRMMAAVLRESKKLGCQKVDMDASAKAYALIALLIDSGVGAGGSKLLAANQTETGVLDLY